MASARSKQTYTSRWDGCPSLPAPFYVVDRARVNGSTRYSPEAPAEGLYQVGPFTSGLSDLYHGCFF